jgi:DNA processing protein
LLREEPRVAIIGSRDASPEGLQRARALATQVVAAGGVVVSGLARGIDTAAHLGALEAGGRTVAVIGTPLDRAHPPENADLQARIAREHLVVSQFAPGTRTTRSSFPLRNATMALLSHATLIVEAGERSGTRYQAEECERLGRSLILLDTLVHDPSVSWAAAMAERGALVLPVARMASALEQSLLGLAAGVLRR